MFKHGILLLSALGAMYHSHRSDKFEPSDRRFAYHVYMMKIYVDIMGHALQQRDLKERILDRKYTR